MDFEQKKVEISKDLIDLLKKYNAFTKEVSIKHWRTTGNHYATILKIISEVSQFSEMLPDEKEIPWVKKQLNE